MEHSVSTKRLADASPLEEIPTDFGKKCKYIEKIPKIKFKDHSKNWCSKEYNYEETYLRSIELSKIQKIETSKIKKLGLYQSDTEIKCM